MKTVIISLGGSLIVPDKVDSGFLAQFRKLILSFTGKGNMAAIITGGGKTAKDYINAAKKITGITDSDLDWIGIAATKINAEIVRSIFGNIAYERIVENPTEKINTDKKIIVGSGWKPGFSSDMDAVLIAKNLKANTIINLSNVDYVYDKNPKEFKDAKPIKEISWHDFLKIAGNRWTPRMNVPFDPIAAKEAMKNKLKVIVANGKNLGNLKNILEGKTFKGTTIS